jgi:hypothetical protein
VDNLQQRYHKHFDAIFIPQTFPEADAKDHSGLKQLFPN